MVNKCVRIECFNTEVHVTVGKGSDGLVFLGRPTDRFLQVITVIDRHRICQKGYSKQRYDIWRQKKADRVYLATCCLPSQTRNEIEIRSVG